MTKLERFLKMIREMRADTSDASLVIWASENMDVKINDQETVREALIRLKTGKRKESLIKPCAEGFTGDCSLSKADCGHRCIKAIVENECCQCKPFKDSDAI